MDGTTCADILAWWQVNFLGVDGWVAEGSGSEYFMEPTTSPITEFNGSDVEVEFKNVSFSYNGVFGKKVQAITVFVLTPDPNTPEGINITPQAVEFTFQDGNFDVYRQPIIDVYPVSDYQK